jgi:hypothetical protein
VRARAWLVLPVVALVYASGVVAAGPALAAPNCFGKPATILGTPGDDTLRGTPGPDVIIGGGGNDTVRGLDGDDRICGGDGSDALAGGEGGDRIQGGGEEDVLRGGPSSFTDFDEIGHIHGNDRLKGGPGNDAIWAGRGLLDFLYGGVGNDSLHGSQRETFLSGQAGNDTLSGGEGPDTLWGGSGDDHLGGGEGGHDRVLFVGDRGPIEANLATGRARGDGSDTVSSVMDILVVRTRSDAVLTGDGRGNFFLTWGGNDRIQARGGRDFVLPQAGADVVALGEEDDFVDTKDGVRGNDSVTGGPGTDTCMHDAKDARRSCEKPATGAAPVALDRLLALIDEAVASA